MAEPITFIYGTEAEILALTIASPNWINRAFYYPNDRDYFFQALDGVMKKYAGGESFGIGAKVNGKVMGGVKTCIASDEILDIPECFDYNTFSLDVTGQVNCSGQVNIFI